MGHVKNFDQHINESDRKWYELTYAEKLEIAKQNAKFKVGEQVMLKKGAYINYKTGKPRERWKDMNIDRPYDGEHIVKILEIKPSDYDEKSCAYLCSFEPPYKEVKHKTIWNKNFTPDEKSRIIVSQQWVKSMSHDKDVVEIFPYILDELAAKLGIEWKGAKLKGFKDASETNATAYLFKVEGSKVLYSYKTSRDRNRNGYHTTDGQLGVFLNREDAQRYADTLREFFKDNPHTYATDKNSKSAVEIKFDPDYKYKDSVTFKEETIMQMAKDAGIDVDQIRTTHRGSISGKKLGIV